MWCFVSQLNSVVLEIDVDPKADGQECLDKVCEQLGIIETDYFGLQYRSNKGETLWLNLRNRIAHQVTGPAPHRLQLRVKFFVQPHFILQEATRHQFYLQVKHDLQSGTLEIDNDDMLARMVALMAYVEYGDPVKNSYQQNLYAILMHDVTELTGTLKSDIHSYHLRLMGMPTTGAEYRLLQEASQLVHYGTEYHDARIRSGDAVNIGVGPQGIFIHNLQTKEVETIAYPLIQMATHVIKQVILRVFNEAGDPNIPLIFKLTSVSAANALYRCVTEMHSFYRCDTVRDDVSSQYSRDLKGTLISLFYENTSLGKNYVFDIRRTSREAYDHARRKLYSSEMGENANGCCHMDDDEKLNNNHHEESTSTVFICKCRQLQDKLTNIEDSLRCCVCMDNVISTALCPCWHAICCTNCAERLSACPLCRSSIDRVQRVFLPTIQLWHSKTSLKHDDVVMKDED